VTLGEGPFSGIYLAGSLRLNRRLPFWRTLTASAAIAAAVALAGCKTDGIDVSKAMKPLSPQMVALIEQKGMTKESPILGRIFKEESELEIWKQDRTGRFALLKTYPICRWSGELGPKIKEGDRQAPEGFYTIAPGQMNPNSSFYLSFNIGYPNEFDRAHGRTGAHLMVHGDCSSRGCYAMTDDQISEIYSLARESFFGGQQAFQIQAYPFRMTPLNMAKHRNSPHFAFWKMLKQGYDHFEVSRLQPKVSVCDRRYVFNAEQPRGAITPLKFDPAGKCPPYEVNRELLEAVAEKQKTDDTQFAQLVQRGTPTVPVRTGRDGGMHQTFLAKLTPRPARDPDGSVRYDIDPAAASKLGSYVVPPRDPDTPPANTAVTSTSRTMSLASAESKSAPRVAAAEPESAISRISRWVGLSGYDANPEQAKAVPMPKSAPPPRPAAAASLQPAPRPQLASQPAEAQAEPPVRTTAAGGASLMSGAAPVIQSDSFESRFGSMR
jgi:murein L,D-transpeptidase YafK